MPSQLSKTFGDRTAYDLLVTNIEYVIERQPHPDWRITDFANPRSSILAYCVSGRAHYLIDGTAYEVTAGDVLYMRRGAPHTASSDSGDPWRFVSTAFTLVDPTLAEPSEPEAIPVITRGVRTDAAPYFQDMYTAWAGKDPGHLLRIRGAIALTLNKIIAAGDAPEREAPYQRRISKVTQLLAENVDRTYSVEELAGLCNLSSSHFRTLFKRATGLTATQYQQHLKIARATEFLASGEYNVTEAARASGFRDVYYFSYLYKKLTGINPSAVARS
ncbi:helix-turn-helix domain-containing protein [Streptomyces sp. NPDC001046]|uniref:helix-turn-helix domain-containing protein n=1 Tax=unclassified Streptomyces TaxID=2593676 RepID=UPI00362B1C12